MGYNLVKQRDVKFIFQDLMPGDIFIRLKNGGYNNRKHVIKSIDFRKKMIYVQPILGFQEILKIPTHTVDVEAWDFKVFEECFHPFKRRDGSNF